MFISIGGVLYSLDPPTVYLWGGRDPPGNRRACFRDTSAKACKYDGIFRHIYVKQLVASNFAKNRENAQGDYV